MNKDIIQIDITDVAYGGKGVGRHDGCVVFVPGALNGEKVKAKVISVKKNFMEAELVEVVSSNPERTAPDCPLTDICPGCCYQHVSYEEEVRIKQSQLESLLSRFASVKPDVCQSPQPSPRETHYRNKVVLHAQQQNGKCVLGYYGHDNKSMIDVPACPLAVKEINDRIGEVRSDADFIEGLEDGSSLFFRWTEADGVRHWIEGAGEIGSMTEVTESGRLMVPARSFYQVNPWISPLLTGEVKALIERIAPDYLVDMYCGVGVFALAAAEAGVSHVLGIDRARPAIRAARQNARDRGFDESVEFECLPVERIEPSAFDRIQPGRTTVVIDPPRSGIDRKVRGLLQELRPQNIIYVSCAADTLSRDIAVFKNKNYKVRSVKLLDMFPRTGLFETVAHLERVN